MIKCGPVDVFRSKMCFQSVQKPPCPWLTDWAPLPFSSYPLVRSFGRQNKCDCLGKKKKSLTSLLRDVQSYWPRQTLRAGDVFSSEQSAALRGPQGQTGSFPFFVFVNTDSSVDRASDGELGHEIIIFFFFLKRENKVWTPALLLSRWHCFCVKHWEEEEEASTRARDPNKPKKKKKPSLSLLQRYRTSSSVNSLSVRGASEISR